MENQWTEYLNKFEMNVMVPLFEAECAIIKPEPVPLFPGKLKGGLFGQTVGLNFEYAGILSFDYYGLFKLSTGINDVKKRYLISQKKTTIPAPVIHFSSVKIEHIEEYSKELLLDFVAFKRYIVYLRWNRPI